MRVYPGMRRLRCLCRREITPVLAAGFFSSRIEASTVRAIAQEPDVFRAHRPRQRSVGTVLICEISEKSRSVSPPTSCVDISIRTLRKLTWMSG